MDFQLSEEHKMFQEAVRGFAERHLKEGALARAHAHAFPYDVAKLMAEQGLLGITIKEEDGGIGGTLMDAVLAIEQISQVCPRSADVIQAGNFGAIRTFAEYATPDQKEQYLPGLLAGEKVVAVGMTEPNAGSAATDLETTATPDGDGYRINGQKVFIGNSEYADVIVLYVRFGPGIDGIGSVLIEDGMEGYTKGAPTPYLNGERWVAMFFDNVYVPKDRVLLGPGGFKKQIAGFNAERIGNTSRSISLARYAYNQAREYALEREQFGRQICEFQGIQWKFADMKVKLDAGQLLLYRAAVNADRGLPDPQETSIAKLFCNQAGFEICNESMQVMGALGFSQDSLVEYCLRRCRGWMIAGGSLEMMRNRIAEGVFERRFSQRPPKPKPAAE
jgi:alkylation response protein AidB-like acyl-CoA dehydrogenase